MKKLMIVAAAAAMTGASYAACKPGEVSEDCAVVFDLSASGKISGQNAKDTYKANQSLKAKGWMLINSDYQAEVAVNFKYQGKKINAAFGGEVIQWGAYGKNLSKFEDGSYKAGATYKFDSDLGVAFEDQTDAGLNAYLSTFGSVKAKISKAKETGKGSCNPGRIEGCIPTWTPGKYTGYFAGYFETCADQIAPEFACVFPPAELCLIGAKVTLKYNSKLDTIGDVEQKFLNKYGKYEFETPVTGYELRGDFDYDSDDEY